MSTIKVIPQIEGDKIVCEEVIYNPRPDAKDYTFSRYAAPDVSFNTDLIDWKLRNEQKKNYKTLPSDSEWFKQRLGTVIEVRVGVGDLASGTFGTYALPPKQDHWDEAWIEANNYAEVKGNGFYTVQELKDNLIEYLKQHYTIQKKN